MENVELFFLLDALFSICNHRCLLLHYGGSRLLCNLRAGRKCNLTCSILQFYFGRTHIKKKKKVGVGSFVSWYPLAYSVDMCCRDLYFRFETLSRSGQGPQRVNTATNKLE